MALSTYPNNALLNPKGRVITTAGTPAKCKQLKEMGCHAAINYKDKDWRKQLGTAMKNEKDGKKGNGWADVFFDNGKSWVPRSSCQATS
jgi:NADPH-dependent curcumin reductase CurA